MLVVFVGHGAGEEVAVSLVLDSDAVSDSQEAALRFDALVSQIKQSCLQVGQRRRMPLRQFYLVDACFSARAHYAAKTVGSLPKAKRKRRGSRLPHYGVAVLCSCNQDEESLTLADGSRTLFTGSASVLRCPDASDRKLAEPCGG